MEEGSYNESKIPWKLIATIQILVVTIIASTVVFSYMGAFPFGDFGIYRILPGDVFLDFVWLYILTILIGAVVYFASPALSIFFWKLHRIITGRNYDYYVQQIDMKTTSSFTFRRMFLPALVALGISFSISNVRRIVDMIIVTEGFDSLAPEAQSIVTSISLLFILLLLVTFIVLLFAPMWLMQDAGLVCEKRKKSRSTTDIDGVGNWYLKLLKGFAGISTIVAYLFTILQTIEWYQFVLTSPPEGGLSLLIFLIPLIAVVVSPLLALGPISVVYVLYEISLTRNLKRLRSHIDRDGFRTVDIDLKETS
ncbi:MAG: hypothetical protein ACXAAO_10000 [Candidatus Thorarchaeota archaeon]|jgi:hypothetical protein